MNKRLVLSKVCSPLLSLASVRLALKQAVMTDQPVNAHRECARHPFYFFRA
jgi:hypothetical protein